MVITTRDPSLPHPDLEPGALTAYTELSGLGRLDALELAGQILKDRGIPRPAREKLSDLLVFLGGHPLSIQLVVPHLRNNTPEKLIAEFDELLPGFTTGAGKERNQSLQVSFDFSLRRLGDDTRQVLPDLAVFQGGAMELQILGITGFTIQQWRQVRDELARAALLTIDQGAGLSGNVKDVGQFSGYYVRFHPTLLPYLTPQLTPARRAELETRYAQAYYALANHAYQSDSKNPLPTRAIVMRELPNFRRALDLVVAAGDLDTAAQFAECIAMFLNVFGRWSERDAMMAQVSKMQDARSKMQEAASGDQDYAVRVPHSEFLMLSNQGERLLQLGRAGEAEQVFRALLTRLGEEASFERAVTLTSLGRCLRAQGQQRAAAETYRQKLVVLAQLEQSKDVKRSTGIAHTDLANVLTDMGQFDAARQEYEAGLQVAKETNDDRQQGVVLSDLGTLALMQNDLNEARRRYLEALDIFRANNEPQSEAGLWHQLGAVAQEARDWAEAERCYKKSLGISERMGNVSYAGQTCNQLAIAATGAGRLGEAERWYLRAIELDEEMGNPKEIALDYSNLAGLYLTLNRLDEAERFAHRAREIKETLDLSSEPWKTYSILAEIAEKRGRVEEAQRWRRKEAQTRQAFDERAGGQNYAPILKQFEGVIQGVIAAVNGDATARAQVEGLFDTLQERGWQINDAIQRIWNGERDEEALTDNISANSAAIVRRVLTLLQSPSSQPFPMEGEGAHTSPAQGEVDEPQGESGEGESGEGITLEQIISLVIAGAQSDGPAGGQAYQIVQVMQDNRQPQEIRALGKGLQNVLEGLRGAEAVQGLPPEAAQIVQVVLAQLE